MLLHYLRQAHFLCTHVPIASSTPVFKGTATSGNSLLCNIIFCGVRLNPLGTAATTGLLYQPQMMMVTVEQLVE
jgi:hypothetical protein